MSSPKETLVHLRVRDRRFYGTWKRLQNLILPSRLFRSAPGDFIIRVNHIAIQGRPNTFPAVQFFKGVTFHVNRTNGEASDKTIISFAAHTAELVDAHLAALTCALTDHGGCHEFREYKPSSLYRL